MIAPEFFNGEIVLDLDSTIFKIQSEKIINFYEQTVYNYLYNDDNTKNDEKANITTAYRVDEKIKKLKKERNKKKGLSFQTLSLLVTFSFIYFSCKGIIDHFKLNGNQNIKKSI
ncbi:conserved Plasmodium protein, unknown function [Plasmodium gallinaceum]|uniref:Uncharacterized protein n=1 Tax=Plasmodium gallinaceum TaxID=5849 RepID=A0A1J1GWB3_PLAGA|nr:conserved Plasmodium protein, unknown function [Plasmodium gallinaceum]CRG96833.1 conserved Plasmodium protein, unknown function [Plasmodium gallinaceum]